MRIFLVVDEDHHRDPSYTAFRKPGLAIEAAQAALKVATRRRTVHVEVGLTQEMERDGWLFYARIGEEGDSVHVQPVDLS